MTAGFGYTEIGTWLSDLPDELVASVGQVTTPGAGFTFVVRADPVDVHVSGSDGEEPLVIEATVAFSEAVRSAIRADPDRFFREATPVLASAPGFHEFTHDGDAGTRAPISAVTLRHHVYPDGASKHAILTGVIDVLTAAEHLADAGDRLVDAPNGA